MIDRLAPAIENPRPLRQTGRHPVQDCFVLETRDRAKFSARALQADGALVARQFVDVVDLLQLPQQRR
jgi:hypothetical protein